MCYSIFIKCLLEAFSVKYYTIMDAKLFKKIRTCLNCCLNGIFAFSVNAKSYTYCSSCSVHLAGEPGIC